LSGSIDFQITPLQAMELSHTYFDFQMISLLAMELSHTYFR